MIICSSCGANMKFDPDLQKLKCEHCGKTQECSSKENEHVIVAESDNDYYEATVFKCPQCGAKLISTDETAGTFCSYCGSSVLIKENICKMQKPDCVIPFSISKEKCEEIYKKHLSKSWFAPNELKNNYVIEKIRGIYMPYWIYNFKGKSDMKFDASKSWRNGDYVYTQHYDVFVKNEGNYEGVTFDSSSNFYDDLSQAISDYNINESKSFNEGYLSGFYVDASNVPSSIYEDNAREIIAEDAESIIMKNKTCKKYDCNFLHLGEMFSKTKFDLGYFPVWFLSIKNKTNDRVSYAAINGSTGKVAMDMPISIPKFIVSLLIIAITMFLVFNTFLMVTPKAMTYMAIAVNLIGIIIINKNYDEIYNKENRLMDEGVEYIKKVNNIVDKNLNKKKVKSRITIQIVSLFIDVLCMIAIVVLFPVLISICMFLFSGVQNSRVIISFGVDIAIIGFIMMMRSKKNKYIKKMQSESNEYFIMPFKQKINKLLCPIIAIVLSIMVLLVNFAADEYYYLAEIISFILFEISSINIVKSLNLLASRKLPQFNKRGGDTDE